MKTHQRDVEHAIRQYKQGYIPMDAVNEVEKSFRDDFLADGGTHGLVNLRIAQAWARVTAEVRSNMDLCDC
jgi:hypothetical protein